MSEDVVQLGKRRRLGKTQLSNGGRTDGDEPDGDCEEFCRFTEDYKREAREAMAKIREMHQWGDMLKDIKENTGHLAKMDPLAWTFKIVALILFGIFLCTALIAGKTMYFTPSSMSVGEK